MGATAEALTGVGRRRIIERPRLTRLLDETSARVIMLIAPAGYGKTTLARQWLDDRPHAWYQAGVASSDVAALGLGLADTACTLLPDVGRRLREWLPTSRGPEDEVGTIARFLSEDLGGWPDDAWFVIDDYQLLSSAASEDLIRSLFAGGERRLLLTSRQRPVWSSARELLYGSAFELGQSSLAMNAEEANAVLPARNAETAGGLVALADGWPAVIGLAALMPHAIAFDVILPEELHDYLAAELFASLPEGVRDQLCGLALLPVVSREGADAMLGPHAEDVLAAARYAGMFSSPRGQNPAFHPLLRTFLIQKLHDLPNEDRSYAVTRAADFLIQGGFWGEAFSLIADFGRPDLLDRLFVRAIADLTKQGRLATLREWVDFAKRHQLSSPYKDLAEAELLFRQGRYQRGGVLARAAASALDPDDPLLSVAHFRAGQNRYFVDDAAGGLHDFRAAYESARSVADARNALWGQFAAAQELESLEALELLDKLESLGSADSDAAARNLCGRVIVAMQHGPAVPAPPELKAARATAEEATDPLIRSGLWRVLAGAFVLSAEYSLAVEAVEGALRDAEDFHLDFARPHALVSNIAANIGLRRFSQARSLLHEVEQAACEMNDPYLTANADMLRCRLFLNEGSYEAAIDAVSGTWSRGPTPARQMEFAVMKATALACGGDPRSAMALLRQVEDASRLVEPRLLLHWSRCLCLLQLGEPQAMPEIRKAYDATLSSKAFDVFVFASRLHPKILMALAEDKSLHEGLAAVLTRSNDYSVVRAHGIAAPRPRPSQTQILTPREREVYELLGEGRSNREIARALFISEPTVKVHVQHILRKLGLHTRLEVALHVVKTQQLQAHAEEDDAAAEGSPARSS